MEALRSQSGDECHFIDVHHMLTPGPWGKLAFLAVLELRSKMRLRLCYTVNLPRSIILTLSVMFSLLSVFSDARSLCCLIIRKRKKAIRLGLRENKKGEN